MAHCIQCFATKQTINPGDRCQVLPILQSRTYSLVEMQVEDVTHKLYGTAKSTCYPGAFWQPMGAFISAVYDDEYARANPEDMPSNRRVLLEFFTDLLRKSPKVLPGENTSHEIPVDLGEFMAENAPGMLGVIRISTRSKASPISDLEFSEFTETWNYVWDAVRKNRLFCADMSGVLRPVQFAALHQKTFEHLIVNAEQDTYSAGTYNQASYLQRLVGAVKTEIAARPEDAWLSRESLMDGLKLHQSDSVHALLFPYFGELRTYLDDHLADKLTFAEYLAVMRPILNGVYALKGLDNFMLQFSPIAYAGQDYQNYAGREYARFVTRVAKEVIQQRKDYYGED